MKPSLGSRAKINNSPTCLCYYELLKAGRVNRLCFNHRYFKPIFWGGQCSYYLFSRNDHLIIAYVQSSQLQQEIYPIFLALQIISEATGKSKSALMLPHLEQKAVPPLNKRRLLPLRHVPQQTGYAASLTYALQQNPPLLPLTQVCPFQHSRHHS